MPSLIDDEIGKGEVGLWDGSQQGYYSKRKR